jgi:hypothetical protein
MLSLQFFSWRLYMRNITVSVFGVPSAHSVRNRFLAVLFMVFFALFLSVGITGCAPLLQLLGGSDTPEEPVSDTPEETPENPVPDTPEETPKPPVPGTPEETPENPVPSIPGETPENPVPDPEKEPGSGYVDVTWDWESE